MSPVMKMATPLTLPPTWRQSRTIATRHSPDVLALVTGAANPGGSVNYVTFFDSSGAIAAIEGNGAGGVAYVTSGADFAEYLPLSRALRAAPAPRDRARPGPAAA